MTLEIKRKKAHTIYLSMNESKYLDFLAVKNKCTKSQVVEALINNLIKKENENVK